MLAGIAQGRTPVENTAICSSKDRVTEQNHVNNQKFDICALYNDKLRLTVISLINNPEKSLELFQKLNTPPKQVQEKSVVGRIKKKMLTTTYLGFLLASSTPVILQIFTLKINTTSTT